MDLGLDFGELIQLVAIFAFVIAICGIVVANQTGKLLKHFTEGEANKEPVNKMNDSDRKMRALLVCVLLFGIPAMVDGQIIDPSETCEEKKVGSACWLKLQNRPGCYVWHNTQGDIWKVDRPTLTARWTGSCTNDKAEGEGILARTWSDNSDTAEGRFNKGKKQGTWTATTNKYRNKTKTPYVDGRPHGTSIAFLPLAMTAMEIPYVDGIKHGTQTIGDLSGTTRIPFVNGKRHGTEVKRNTAEQIVKFTEWVNGEKQE